VEHSSELISGAGARALFREIKERYANRIVIYDLPPVLATDDAISFLPQVDAALMVVGDGRTHREDLLRCLELLRDTPILGTVLNGSRRERSAEYAY
jgi:Mrp family chromosome partitioning ATPase